MSEDKFIQALRIIAKEMDMAKVDAASKSDAAFKLDGGKISAAIYATSAAMYARIALSISTAIVEATKTDESK